MATQTKEQTSPLLTTFTKIHNGEMTTNAELEHLIDTIKPALACLNQLDNTFLLARRELRQMMNQAEDFLRLRTNNNIQVVMVDGKPTQIPIN